MTPQKIEAYRRLLFMSIPEASRWLGRTLHNPKGVNDRYWRLLENGQRSVSLDIQKNIRALVFWRTSALAVTTNRIKKSPLGSVYLIWYHTEADWLSLKTNEVSLWRPQQSVVADMLSKHSNIEVVSFDLGVFKAWLGNNEDTEIARDRWAAGRSSGR